MHINKKLPLGKLDHKFLQSLIGKLPPADKTLVIPPGVGLDAAGVKIGNQMVAITTDPITFTTDQIGTYSVAVNINDVACLGCKPHWYLATLLLPQGTSEATVKKIWGNLAAELKRYKIQAAGGHVEVTNSVSTPVIVGQMIGELLTAKFLTPLNAKAGDQILLWNPVAIEGIALLATELASYLTKFFSKQKIKAMQNLLHKPGICIWPFVEKIVKTPGLVALHDITEGGIATALHELADASKCGLKINAAAITVRQETQELARILKFNPLGLLASGSLLIVVKKKFVAKFLQTCEMKFESTPVVIGELTDNSPRLLQNAKEQSKLPRFDTDEVARILTKNDGIIT